MNIHLKVVITVGEMRSLPPSLLLFPSSTLAFLPVFFPLLQLAQI